MYSSSRDRTIRAWNANVEGHAPVRTYEGHKLVVTSIDLNRGMTRFSYVKLSTPHSAKSKVDKFSKITNRVILKT